MKSGPSSPQLEKAHTRQQRPNADKNKINKINKFIKKKEIEEINPVCEPASLSRDNKQ